MASFRTSISCLTVMGVIVLLAACSAAPAPATGPVTVTGIVKDDSSDPVAGCLITPHSPAFDGREIGITSTNAGTFAWPGITPGAYTFAALCLDAHGNTTAIGESESYDIDADSVVEIKVS